MIGLPFDQIDRAALEALVANGVAERRDLEFKRDLPGDTPRDTHEFLADVTSLANAQGGDLIFGIEEDDGTAKALLGLDVRTPAMLSP
jgi:predicted HTH transcriptional regulator